MNKAVKDRMDAMDKLIRYPEGLDTPDGRARFIHHNDTGKFDTMMGFLPVEVHNTHGEGMTIKTKIVGVMGITVFCVRFDEVGEMYEYGWEIP